MPPSSAFQREAVRLVLLLGSRTKESAWLFLEEKEEKEKSRNQELRRSRLQRERINRIVARPQRSQHQRIGWKVHGNALDSRERTTVVGAGYRGCIRRSLGWTLRHTSLARARRHTAGRKSALENLGFGSAEIGRDTTLTLFQTKRGEKFSKLRIGLPAEAPVDIKMRGMTSSGSIVCCSAC